MNVIDLIQGDAAWHEWRRNGVSATDSVVLLGASPHKTPWRLWAEKVGYALSEDLSANPYVRRGQALEDTARSLYEAQTGELLLPLCVEHSQLAFLRASLDGINDNGEPVEFKCPSDKNWEAVCTDGTSSAPYQLYYPQVQHQMLVTEAARGWLVFYMPNEPLNIFEILPNRKMQKQIIKNGRAFIKQVEKRKEPDKDPDRDVYIPSGDVALEWNYAADQYRRYESEIKLLKEKMALLQKQQKPLEAQFKTMMSDFLNADFGGVKVTLFQRAGLINYKNLLKAELPNITDAEMEKYRSKSTNSCRITVKESLAPKLIVDEQVLQDVRDLSVESPQYYF